MIFCMKKWARLFDDPTKVDVIQFNCGHWDVAHWCGHELPLTSEDEYAKNIQNMRGEYTFVRSAYTN